ncbi:unnamed protein product [Cuscuta campestris]|uniref:NAC domain-containing protein n=1 Tax=Cuscuta campestris TaxID=132261 RepID=A0A484KWV2_9ASTE|nr:unnamed protein product [Cuscuta campestris]
MTEDGLRFRPTDAELLKMLRQFTDGDYTGGLVERRDLYADEEPWEICTGRGTVAAEDNTWYFFTELKRKAASKGRPGKRFIRSVGKGTWHGTSKVETIFNPERKQSLLGFKRNFTYWGGDDEERKGEFVMNEFSLPEGTAKSDRKDFVICRLKRKKRGPVHHDNDDAAEDAPRMILLSQEQENNNDDAAEDAPRMMLLSHDEEEGNNNNNNKDEDVSFSYDELFGGIEVEDMTAAPGPGPALLQQDAGSNETYPYACTTNNTAAVVAAPLSGVSGDTTWTLEMVEDFLLKDDDDIVGGGDAAASAAAIQEDNKAYDEWVSSMLDDFEVQHGGSGGEHNSFEFPAGGGSVAHPAI